MESNHILHKDLPLSSNKRQFVINWHITESCNYKCRYCYAKWDRKETKRELMHDRRKTFYLLKDIYEYFYSISSFNASADEKHYKSPRLNLAGGEPLLHEKKIMEVIEAAIGIGFEVSVISNGSRLNSTFISELAPKISLLGISMDSGAKETNREIGRCDIHGKTLTANGLANVVDQIRAINPLLEIKINTVVNALNWHENMCSEILRIAPTKWKVLRMLPIRTNDLAIDDSMFRSFVKRHAFLSNIMRVEDNQDMIESYIMIDPYGCFFQNSSVGDKYNISEPILDVGIEKAFKQIHWSEKKFFSRYAIPLLGENHEI